MITGFCLLGLAALDFNLEAPDYTIEAVRYGTIPQFRVSGLVVGAPASERLDIPLVFWLVRGGGRDILLDAGCHRQPWIDLYKVTELTAKILYGPGSQFLNFPSSNNCSAFSKDGNRQCSFLPAFS